MLQELEDRLHRTEQGGIESVFESDCVELLIPKQAPPSMQSSGQKSMNSMTTYLAKNIFFIMFTMLAKICVRSSRLFSGAAVGPIDMN